MKELCSGERITVDHDTITIPALVSCWLVD
jgi:hypothetical protein